MLKNLKKKSEGFTIIEVLIVLAIAGLILLIVFLAVPALQRNARNTTIKNDAAGLASGLSEYSANNNGQAPASLSTTTTGVITVGASGTAQATVKTNGGTTTTLAAVSSKPSFAAGTIWWQKGTTCDGTVNSRAMLVYYAVESGSNTGSVLCIDAS